MDLHTLSREPGSKHRRKRVGRGMGSGTGKTSGKGHKGQMARKGGKHKAGFEGGQMRLIRRLPKRGFHNPARTEYMGVNVCALNVFDAETELTPEIIIAAGLANGRHDGIKILGVGEIDRKLSVTAHAFSAAARTKIEAAGGTCNEV
ncbi:MAG: 50S ribosomal protein L15 [Verrucomicrobia bacterium]|jgi:large subunit ribosomal protein L15|nr:50S ribosomal protein L15 [Verrucomicrobiota bacterium]MBT7065834.1 50S ribosomal protein L15 [Verrucomicrobiota bacterium]MBT7698816.1 50S ribosomal protein L15 [Verrucomicrobiota bacterium]